VEYSYHRQDHRDESQNGYVKNDVAVVVKEGRWAELGEELEEWVEGWLAE
jgi:hypothetical protein